MFDARSQTDPLKAYKRICWLLLAAFLLFVGLVERGTLIQECLGSVCRRPEKVLLIFRETGSVQGVSITVEGLFARQGIPVWVAWGFGLILPVLMLVTAVYIMPKRPWKA